jgi:hypothetical protein
MNRFARASLVIVAGAGVSLTASPAWAHSDEPDGGGWVPIEELRPDFYDPQDVEACGTTVTLTTGDVADVEGRETTLPNGDTLFEARGDMTIDVTRHDTGEVIDELDISGPVTEQISADGTHITATLGAPSILFPIPEFGPVDAAAFEAAGIPDLAYYKKGTVTFHVVVNTETGEFVSEEADVDARLHDLCTWFGDDEHGKSWHHGHGYDHHGRDHS